MKKLKKYFKIKGSVYQTYFNHKLNHFRFGCQQILRLLNELDVFYKNPVSPPAWVLQEEYLFGAYLAGLIDGDGDVRISRKKYPQCKVRIHGSKEPKRLVAEIERHLKCGAHSTIRIRVNKLKGRVFKSRGSVTEFAISKKNILFINKYVVPHLTLEYKKDKIMKIKKRAVPGI